MFFKKSTTKNQFDTARTQYDANRAKENAKQEKERRKRFDKVFAKIRKSMVNYGSCTIEKEEFDKANISYLSFPTVQSEDQDRKLRNSYDEQLKGSGDFAKFIAEAREAGLVVKYSWNKPYKSNYWIATGLFFTFKRNA